MFFFLNVLRNIYFLKSLFIFLIGVSWVNILKFILDIKLQHSIEYTSGKTERL